MTLQSHARGMEAITVRRTKVVDADKVRYRVYSNPSEFIAVIAESALMAVKVSGIKEPHRIVRDLPTEGVAVEAAKIARAEAEEKVAFSTTMRTSRTMFKTEITPPGNTAAERFIPMKLRDLNAKQKFEGFVIPHEILNQLIEAVRKPAPDPPPAPAKAEPATPAADLSSELVAEPAPEPPKAEADVLSPEEVDKLLKD